MALRQKKFKKLRCAMIDMDVTHEWLAEQLCCSRTYISNRFKGKESWTVWEAHKICNLLKVPTSDMLTYFPPEDAQIPSRMVQHKAYCEGRR